jgi:hypothetical protein
MSLTFPAAGPISTSGPDAQPFVGSAGPALSAAAAGPAMRLLWQNTTTGERSIWLMNGTSWDGSSVILPQVPTVWSIVGSGDFNGDGNADILWQNTSTGERSIWFMSGNNYSGNFALLPQVPTVWSVAGVGDFNGDNNPDILWQNTVTGERSIWFMNGSTYSSAALLPQVPTVWSIAAVGDFNGDGKPDLVWQNTTTGERSIWFMNGSTYSSAALLPTVPTAWRIVAAADFDGDGKTDLVWQNATTGERSIWIMNGAVWTGNFALLPTVSTQWSIVAAPTRVPTSIGGIISSSTTLTASASPYVLSQNVQIAHGATLTVEPGVQIVGNGKNIEVWGEFVAIGTATSRILLKNTNIVPRGDYVGSAPVPFLIQIEFSEMRGGSLYAPTGIGVYGSLLLRDSKLYNVGSYRYLWYPVADCYIERNVFQGSGGISVGVDSRTLNRRVLIRNNTFLGWTTTPVENWASYKNSAGDETTIVEYNSFLDVGRVAVELPPGYSDASMSAIHNYWGTTDEGLIQSMIYDRTRDLNSAAVIPYTPFLTQPDPNSPPP